MLWWDDDDDDDGDDDDDDDEIWKLQLRPASCSCDHLDSHLGTFQGGEQFFTAGDNIDSGVNYLKIHEDLILSSSTLLGFLMNKSDIIKIEQTISFP